jgi:HNH endonuclease
MNEKEIEEFWRRVDVRGPDDCWLWSGGLMSSGDGYGECSVGEVRGAHRCAWTIENGPIPAGYHVRHLCRGPKRCVNPSHLSAAPPRINARDEKIRHLNEPCPKCGEKDRRDTDNRCRGCHRARSREWCQRQRDAARPARRPARSGTSARAGWPTRSTRRRPPRARLLRTKDSEDLPARWKRPAVSTPRTTR